MTDHQSRNRIGKPALIERYDEEYVIKCVITLVEFIYTHGSLTNEKRMATQQKVEQKFSTDLTTIGDETTNDEKILKLLVCLERRSFDQILEEYKEYKQNLSTKFGVVFFDHDHQAPKTDGDPAVTEMPQAINKMNHAARPFWWPKLNKDIQMKCDECISCKMSGKSNKPQLPMIGISYLPTVQKLN